MKQSVILTISLLLLTSSYLVKPIDGKKKGQAAAPAPSPSKNPAPGPSSDDCSTIIYNMADCLSFISEGSTDAKPTKACCEGMNSVLEYNPKCICVGLDSGRQMGIILNNTRAVAMPSLCKATITPPDCGISTGSPGASPAAPTPSSSPSAQTPGNSAAAPPPETSTPTPMTGPVATAPSPASGAGTLSVSVLFVVAMTLSLFA